MYASVKQGVVRIEIPGSLGSGAIIDARGVIVTNRHVVGDHETVGVTLFNGRQVSGRVTRRGEGIDLALIQIEKPPAGLTVIPIGSTADVEEGEEIYVIGHPMDLRWTITRGIISRIRGPNDASRPNTIQIDAPVSPGNSGGPLLAGNGKLLGVVTSKVVAQGAESLGFACPSEKVLEFLKTE